MHIIFCCCKSVVLRALVHSSLFSYYIILLLYLLIYIITKNLTDAFKSYENNLEYFIFLNNNNETFLT